MIVKNEEEFLGKCLVSVYGYVDEIIIVDTGSEDKTVEIAKGFTDRVYHHPWENNFSKARNQALQYATCDWIFQIDADEELLPGSGEELLRAVREAGDADIIFVSILSTYAKGTRVASHNFERLFRNNGIIHYEGAVHNRVVGGVKPKFSKIRLIHHGYDVDDTKSKSKFERTTNILKAEIEKNPRNPLYHHYLGVSYLSREMNEEAAREAELAIELLEELGDYDPIYLWAHFIASMAHYRLNDFDRARFFAKKALSVSSGHLDSLYMLTAVAAEKGEWENVLFYSKKFSHLLELYERHPEKAGILVNNSMKESSIVFSLVGHAYYSLKDTARMRAWYDKAIEYSEGNGKIPLSIGVFHLDRTGNLGLAEDYLTLALKQAPDDPDVWYSLAKLHNKTGSPGKEKECLERLFRNGTRDPVVINRLITLCVERGDLALGLEAAEQAHRENPDSYFVLGSLARIYREKGQIGKALEYYLKALERAPNIPEVWLEVGDLCIEMGKLEDAKIFVEKALSIAPDRFEVMLKLCEVDIKRHDPMELVSHLNCLLEKLGSEKQKTIESIDDLLEVLLEVLSAFKNDTTLASNANRVVELFKSEFYPFPSSDHSFQSGNQEFEHTHQ